MTSDAGLRRQRLGAGGGLAAAGLLAVVAYGLWLGPAAAAEPTAAAAKRDKRPHFSILAPTAAPVKSAAKGAPKVTAKASGGGAKSPVLAKAAPAPAPAPVAAAPINPLLVRQRAPAPLRGDPIDAGVAP